jgi:hypothetical protein
MIVFVVLAPYDQNVLQERKIKDGLLAYILKKPYCNKLGHSNKVQLLLNIEGVGKSLSTA